MIKQMMSREQVISELDGIRQWIAEYGHGLTAAARPADSPLASLALMSPAATYIAADGAFKFVSPQMRQITGYSEEELLGTSPVKLLLPEDRTAVSERTARLLKDGRSYVHKHAILTKNAQVKWVFEAVTLTPHEGKQAIIANVFDITEEKQQEEQWRGVEERYQDLCENTGDMIQCAAPDGRLVYVNRAWKDILGYGDGDLSRLSLFDVVHADYRENCLSLMHQAMSGQKIDDVDLVLISKDGQTIPVEGSLSGRLTGDKPVYIRGIFRDISKRKKSQEEAETMVKEMKQINLRLEQSNRELEDFAHVASHDLQEPLRKISSFGSLLRDSLGDKLTEDDRENFEFMIDGAGRMQTMINDLLGYSRITTQAKPFQQVDPNTVIENLRNFELSAALEESHGLVHVPKRLPVVQGDPSQIHQLLQNLIGNGLKFHRDGENPVITVFSSLMPDNMVRLEVRDNGIGIDAEYHSQIFTMFKRLHSRAKYPGTGVGLTVCKKIVQRHGGQIGVESKLGEGATFWFTLPRWGSGPA